MESNMLVRPWLKLACAALLVLVLIFCILGLLISPSGEHKDEGSTPQTMTDVETETEQNDEKNAHIEKQVEDNNKDIIETVSKVDNTESEVDKTISNAAETTSKVTVSKDTSNKHAETSYIELQGGKYPAAEKIWSAMKKFGWSDDVCAGIMGNLMFDRQLQPSNYP